MLMHAERRTLTPRPVFVLVDVDAVFFSSPLTSIRTKLEEFDVGTRDRCAASGELVLLVYRFDNVDGIDLHMNEQRTYSTVEVCIPRPN